MIKILLVDDHEIVRTGLKMLLETTETYEVVCQAENGQEALKSLKSHDVDLILLDLKMPVMDGLTFLATYKEEKERVPVVVLTTMDDDEKIKKAISLGAKSYLMKDTSRETLLRTIDAALHDEMLLTADVTEKLLAGSLPQSAKPTEDFQLTEREIYILSCVARGDTNKSIALELEISERTVKAHLTNIYQKMDVASRSEATAKALGHGIIH